MPNHTTQVYTKKMQDTHWEIVCNLNILKKKRYAI